MFSPGPRNANNSQDLPTCQVSCPPVHSPQEDAQGAPASLARRSVPAHLRPPPRTRHHLCGQGSAAGVGVSYCL